jgi:hypothetical protein
MRGMAEDQAELWREEIRDVQRGLFRFYLGGLAAAFAVWLLWMTWRSPWQTEPLRGALQFTWIPMARPFACG